MLAGGLVGLAVTCKYPGALVGIAVVAAHLLARGLWLSGAAALRVFAFCSPYVLLDFGAFESHFSAQVAQMKRGTAGCSTCASACRSTGGGWRWCCWVKEAM